MSTGETKRRTTDEMRDIAERLASENPLWLVIFGVYSKQFVAFPRFAAPRGTIITVGYPEAIPERMRQIERMSGIGQDN